MYYHILLTLSDNLPQIPLQTRQPLTAIYNHNPYIDVRGHWGLQYILQELRCQAQLLYIALVMGNVYDRCSAFR
jgi:hypothetical protein